VGEPSDADIRTVAFGVAMVALTLPALNDILRIARRDPRYLNHEAYRRIP